jgi:Glycerol kinase
MKKYIISIDQSTQGTKALLFNQEGALIQRVDKSHRQLINDKGWVSHDPMEICANTIEVTTRLITESGIAKEAIKAIGISNQRETSLAWNKETGEPLTNAIVWQCSRAASICETLSEEQKDLIRQHTGMPASPYFPAAKLAWILKNVKGASQTAKQHDICYGTIDTWLLYHLTNGQSYKTDYSNASRTQLFNIFKLEWDKEICAIYGIDINDLAEVCDSNSRFGDTDLFGLLPNKVPIHAAMGDSHGSLFGQGCLDIGMTKVTYGTGSSIMMNIGDKAILSNHGVVTSLAWGLDGKITYVLEGNLNYTGAVITWLKDDLKLIETPKETELLACEALKEDTLYLIPAFSGLGAPYWNSKAKAAIVGMTRTTGRNEIVRAAIECSAYQITDIITAMSEDTQIKISEIRADGGSTKSNYLMQFQSNIADVIVQIPNTEELSGIGVAYAAGIAVGLWNQEIFKKLKSKKFQPQMDYDLRSKKYNGWKNAVQSVL